MHRVAFRLNSPIYHARKCPISRIAPKRNYASDQPVPTPAKTFANQAKLPRLPIPSLRETSDRYLRSLIPLLSQEEYKTTEQAVNEFLQPRGIGEKLQARLQELDKKVPYSWLEDIWLKKAYLEWRVPTMINVNWWDQFRDPNNGVLKKPPPHGQTSELQLKRAAGFVSTLLEVCDSINRETLPAESNRTGPLCMNQYKCIFGTTRIPDFPHDRLVHQWPTTARHITVLFKDQLFHVPVLDDAGRLVPVSTIEGQLQQVINQVQSLKELQPAVGVLTSENRDVWAKCRKALEASSVNRQSFQSIDTSLFVLCLDDYASPNGYDISHFNLFHGLDAHNRWFDKAFQLIVENNGRAGVNGEHTPVDAVTPGQIFDYVVRSEPAKNPKNASSASLPSPQHLKWEVGSDVQHSIYEAEVNAKKAIDNVESMIIHFPEYGSDLLKSFKVSPDAYVQMALQLAYYRIYGKSCATYETASTRGFLHGRTETVRSCSVESLEFCKTFLSEGSSKQKKIEAFQRAIEAHVEYMRAASNGKGVDRHLLGLRCMVTPEEKMPQIFTDPSYIKGQYFRLSTSNMSPGDNQWGGFGAVVPEGYGTNYAIGRNNLKFSLSAYRDCSETSASEFAGSLKKSLQEMAQLGK
ncbi:uncharacterized protein VTP21DRAFT_9489 [Calcarisporiella thermophila]|uniref:uncharacterized protein n=1 Tax=Calcarisporiella thermophila TaxID=911321 RepID=UPI003743C776